LSLHAITAIIVCDMHLQGAVVKVKVKVMVEDHGVDKGGHREPRPLMAGPKIFFVKIEGLSS